MSRGHSPESGATYKVARLPGDRLSIKNTKSQPEQVQRSGATGRAQPPPLPCLRGSQPPPAEGRYLHQVYKPQQPLLGRVNGQKAKRKIHEMNVRESRGLTSVQRPLPLPHTQTPIEGKEQQGPQRKLEDLAALRNQLYPWGWGSP